MNVGIVYLIEFVTCIAAVYYSNFIYFYMKGHFGFGEVENLLLAAMYGCTYMIASRKGGRFAQRFGYIRSIVVGNCGFFLAMILGYFLDSIPGQAFVLALWTVSVCFIYPAISALASDGAGARLPDRIGFYNMTWAAGSVLAYFFAGMLLERLGMKSLFLIPLALIVLNLLILLLLLFFRRQGNKRNEATFPADFIEERPANSRQFMHLAWFANPLCYVAINIFIPLLPSISTRLGLSTSAAGIVCSVWMFSRLCSFVLLWRWKGWHYRFGWLAGAFAIMAGCFTMLLLSFSLPIFFVAQVGFGMSISLIYYSSLYYSMNASEEKGAHGGLHESMIGAGLLFGPAFGAGVHAFLPAAQNIRAWSVGGLLIAGFSIFLWRGRFCWRPSAVKK